MKSKKVTMLVKIMIVVIMGNLLDQTKAEKNPFIQCFPSCLVECVSDSKFPAFLICPLKCLETCLLPPSSTPPSPSPSSSLSSFSENIIDQTYEFCKFGCAVHHCASLSTIKIPNVKEVAACVDSCSMQCSSKN